MPIVSLVNMPTVKKNIHLSNGDLIIVRGTPFMVSSFIPIDRNERANKYCSLVDLSSGAKAFPEPSSRHTDMSRVLNHLTNADQYSFYNLKESEIVHLKGSQYRLDITLGVANG